MMLLRDPLFVGCDIDVVCFNESLRSVVETFACQVLNQDSDIKGSAEVVAAARTYVSTKEGIHVSRK